MVIKMTVVTEVVIMTSFSKKHLNTLTTDQLSGQLFATLAMFYRRIVCRGCGVQLVICVCIDVVVGNVVVVVVGYCGVNGCYFIALGVL